MRKKSIVLVCSVAAALLGPVGRTENLLEVYQAAVKNDPLIRESEARRLAALEAKPQARGLLFPQISVGGQAYTGNADTEGFQRQFREVVDPGTGESSAVAVSVPFKNNTDTDLYWDYNAQLTQTLFRWDQWQRLKQADSRVALAEANYRVAQQDLMVRVSQRYFDVLAADDTLSAAEATLEAVKRQLEQAEKRFEVGLIAITDVQEARAAHDSATAGVIAAKRTLATAQEYLRELTRGLRPARQARGDDAARPATAGRRADVGGPGRRAEPQRRRRAPRRRHREGQREDRPVGPHADGRPVCQLWGVRFRR